MSPCHIERMVDQKLNAIHELIRFGSCHVQIECRFIDPARMQEKQPRISHRAVYLYPEATRLFANARNGIAQFRLHRTLFTFPRMEAGKDSEFHLSALGFSRFILSSGLIAALSDNRNNNSKQHRTNED